MDTIKKELSKHSGTAAIGQNIGATLGPAGISASIGVAFDCEGNIALQYSYGLSISTTPSDRGAYSSTYRSISNTPTVNDMKGSYGSFGVSGTMDIPNTGFAGTSTAEYNFANAKEDFPDDMYQGITRSDGISTPGTGIDVYAGGGKTTNIKTINIFDEFDKLYRKVMAW